MGLLSPERDSVMRGSYVIVGSFTTASDTDVAQFRTSGKPFQLFWVNAGQYDIALQNSDATVAILKKAGIDVEQHQSAGFHAWNNWRDYLHQFVPLLFKKSSAQ